MTSKKKVVPETAKWPFGKNGKKLPSKEEKKIAAQKKKILFLNDVVEGIEDENDAYKQTVEKLTGQVAFLKAEVANQEIREKNLRESHDRAEKERNAVMLDAARVGKKLTSPKLEEVLVLVRKNAVFLDGVFYGMFPEEKAKALARLTEDHVTKVRELCTAPA